MSKTSGRNWKGLMKRARAVARRMWKAKASVGETADRWAPRVLTLHLLVEIIDHLAAFLG